MKNKEQKEKLGKKTISVKKTVEIDGKKTEIKISKTQKFNPNLNTTKNDIISGDNITHDIASVETPKEYKELTDNPLVNNNAIKTTDPKDSIKQSVNPSKPKEFFWFIKRNNNLKHYEQQLLKLKNNSDNKGKDKLTLEGVIVKDKHKPYYKTRVQFTELKVIEKDNTNRLLTTIASLSLVVLLVVVGRLFVFSGNATGGKNSFNNGTHINGVQVGGLNANQVSQKLTQNYNEKAETFELTLTYEDKSFTFDKNDFKVSSNIHTVIEEALTREKANQTYSSQVNKVNELTKNGNNIMVAFNYIFVGLDQKIDDIAKKIEYDPHDSILVFNPSTKNNFIITEHRTGLKVNKEQLYYMINEEFLKSSSAKIVIPTLIIEPSVTKEYNQSLTNKIAEFSTNVSDSTGSRKHNVKLALERINGLTVQPDQELSFNQLTGPHTLKNGYEVATIIFNGQFVDGVGGGICQASTTLYNALLKADAEILQVSKHTLPVKYVPLGLDAMVSEGVADLRFKNNSAYPLFIKTIANSESVSVEIYSHTLDHGMSIKTRSEVVKKLPHSGDLVKLDTAQKYTDKVLFMGEQYRLSYPKDGYEAKAYVEYYKDNQLVTQKLVRHEVYYPQQGIIIEGIEKRPTSFEKIESNVEKIKPNEETSQDTFLFNIQNGIERLDTIPTSFCP